MSHDPRGNLAAYLRETPIAYVAFRVMHIYSESGEDAMAERDEVPFLSNIFFPLFLTVYVMYRRIYRLLKIIFGRENTLTNVDHLFTMTSDHEYKTHSFLTVGERLRDEGEEVVLLCSPATADDRMDYEDQEFETTTFRELLGGVALVRMALGFVTSVRILLDLRSLQPEGFNAAPTSMVFNVTFLETIKTAGLREATDHPVVHTYAPMPYILESTFHDRVLVYQHGMLLAHPEKIAMGYPFYVPLTYFVWGQKWIDKVGKRAHPESELLPVGNPWHDYLIKLGRRKRGNPEVNILLISNAHGGFATDARERTYELVVRELIEACELRGWSLAIKLHPGGTGEWYGERGWDSHIKEFDGIIEALLATRVAVTDYSSAMIESALLGTPVLVTDSVKSTDLESQLSLTNISFVDPKNLRSAIEEMLSDAGAGLDSPTPEFADGSSVDRIVDVAIDRADRYGSRKPVEQ